MTDVASGPTPREKRCVACGEAFVCCAGSCWCDGVELTEAARASLREQFLDCLCRRCLVAAGGSEPTAVSEAVRRD
jgi:hypothetical protein